MFGIAAVGCSESSTAEQPDPVATKIELSATSVVTASDGGRKLLSIDCDAAWHIEGAVDWCECSMTEGVGAAEVAFVTLPNETFDERRATYRVVSGAMKVPFVVVQKQRDALIVTSDKVEVGAAGESFSVEVKANIAFDYRITYETPDSGEWIIPAVRVRALERTTLNFRALPSEELAARRATITVRSGDKQEVVTVYQAGSHILLLSQKDYVVSADGETIAVELRSNVNYTVQQPQEEWIEPLATRSASTHTLRYLIHPNDTYDARTARIVFADADGCVPPQTVTVTQAQRDAILIAQREYEFGSEGGEFTAEIAANVDFDVTTDAAWIIPEKLPAARGLTASRYRFVIGEYAGKQLRTGIVTVTDGKTTQHITVTQRGVSAEAYRIRYTTTDGLPIDYNDPRLVESNVYADGEGVLTFLEPVESVYGFGSPTGTAYRTLKTVELPEGTKRISSYAFAYCSGLERVTVPASVETIDRFAFEMCASLKAVEIAPQSRLNVIGEAAFIACTALERFSIPDAVTELNRTFQSCHALRSVEIGVQSRIERIVDAFENCKALGVLHLPFATMPELSEKMVLGCNNVMVYVPAALVESYRTEFPYWPVMSDEYLADKYVSTDYSADGEVVTLQRHTQGEGIGLVLMGDGYADFHHRDGSYERVMRKAAEAFFSAEPYASLRPYFDVHFVRTVSANETIAEENASLFDRRKEDSKAFEYARKIPGLDPTRAAIGVIENFGGEIDGAVGMCRQYEDNSSVGYCATGFWELELEFLVLHEVCGHGFGKLDEEYIIRQGYRIDAEGIAVIERRHAQGWWENVDVTDDPASVLWADFIANPLYAGTVGIYEGAGGCAYGVYRPTESSFMGNNGGDLGFNAPSRYSIYKKAMAAAGVEYSWERFVEFDAPARAAGADAVPARIAEEPIGAMFPTARPQFVDRRWSEAD